MYVSFSYASIYVYVRKEEISHKKLKKLKCECGLTRRRQGIVKTREGVAAQVGMSQHNGYESLVHP